MNITLEKTVLLSNKELSVLDLASKKSKDKKDDLINKYMVKVDDNIIQKIQL